jgi:hypothetical protein
LQADILVSELLGSFSDNELSPECLDGAQRLLKEDGISIPASYTSFLAPITSTKMLEAVRGYKVSGTFGIEAEISGLELPVMNQRHDSHEPEFVCGMWNVVECAAAVKIIESSEIRIFCIFCKNEFSIVFGIHMVWP